MARNIVAPTVNDDGSESHPAWVLVGASRVSSSHGAVLFDSDIRHQHYVVVKVVEAERRRDLHHDWMMGRKQIVEFAMSEAQWASFVSSMNGGQGVPATLEWRESADDPEVPGMPYEPRLKESMADVRAAGEKAQADILRAFAAYKEHKTVGNLRTLEAAIDNMPSNLSFAAKSLSEHAENVVTRARADIEAFVSAKVQQLGLEASDVMVDLPELTEGTEVATQREL